MYIELWTPSIGARRVAYCSTIRIIVGHVPRDIVRVYRYLEEHNHMQNSKAQTFFYRIAGNFHGVLIFIIFVVDSAVTKILPYEN